MVFAFIQSVALATTINVGVVDTGSVTYNKVIKNNTVIPEDHGSHVVSTILYGGFTEQGVALSPVCNEVRVTVFNCISKYNKNTYCQYHALLYFLENKFHIVNYSAGGAESDMLEAVLIKTLLVNKTRFIAAAGNEKKELNKTNKFYPASYRQELGFESMEMVSALNLDGSRGSNTNYAKESVHEVGTINAYNAKGKLVSMTGSSMATAKRTNVLVNSLCKEARGSSK